MSTHHPCPCCNDLTLPEPAGGTWVICPTCGWEDDNVQLDNENFEGGANEVSLAQARKNFKEFGYSDPNKLPHKPRLP